MTTFFVNDFIPPDTGRGFRIYNNLHLHRVLAQCPIFYNFLKPYLKLVDSREIIVRRPVDTLLITFAYNFVRGSSNLGRSIS